MTPRHEERSDASGWLAASIVIGSILIALSIFFNGIVISKALSGGSWAGSDTLTPPPAPTGAPAAPGAAAQPVTVEVGNAPTTGNRNAKVTVVEFSDFECPFCGRYYSETLSKLKTEYVDTGKVRFAFKQYPLTAIHANAQKAAEASLCANDQGKFWEYHNTLFENQASLSVTSLKQYAADLELDTAKFNSCLDSGKFKAQVDADVAQGSSFGVSGTPTSFINGVKIVGAVPYDTIKAEIEKQLAAS